MPRSKSNARVKARKRLYSVGVFALIFDENDRILLAMHKPSDRKGKDYVDTWSMPGGAIEYGETAVDALRREIQEETNLEIHDVEMVSYDDEIKSKEAKHWVAINFKARTDCTKLKNLEPHKILELRFFARDEIPDNLSKFARKCIKDKT